jgi:integrase
MASIYPYGDGWRVQIRRAGQKSISRVCKTRAEAKKWAREVEHQADKGLPVSGSKITVAKLIQEYREQRKDSGREIGRHSNTHYMFRRLAVWFATTRLDRLDTAAIVDYARARRRAGVAPHTAYMELTALGTALRYACSLLKIAYHDSLGSARPTLHHLGLIKSEGNKRDRRPTGDEWDRLLIQLAQVSKEVPMVDIVKVAAQNAFRRGEICRIAWPDLDVAARTLLVRARKHPREKDTNDEVVPLIGDSLEIIMRQPRPAQGPDQRIFPYNPQTVSNLFTRAVRAAGLTNLHLHDMRHEATSKLFEAGWQIPEVAAVTGHKDWRQLTRYTNLKPELIAKKSRT